MAMKLSFFGGAGKVTGSNFLIEGARAKIVVDCGLEQGSDVDEQDIYGPFAYDPRAVDALILTHAHLDHVGRIPKLVRDGFKGKIFMTPPTRDLAELILRDSVKILETDAAHRGLPPVYEPQDVETTLSNIELLEYHVEKEVAPGLSVYLRNVGHILGSASVRIRDEEGVTLALTGDIGNSPSPLLPDWEIIPDADVVVMESTYGDRLHPERATRDAVLKEKLQLAIKRGGVILIPAFSLERTQLMLYELSNFFEAGDLPKIPVFLDSPLAIRVTELYEKWGPTYFKPEAEEEMKRERSLFEFQFLTKTLDPRDSSVITKALEPKIIIAGAGMSHGGRIGRWEAQFLPNPSTTLFMVGYQAPGTPGRRIVEGAPSVRLNGAEVKIKAKVEQLHGWSAHADRDELLRFAEGALKGQTKTIFVAIGEPSSERFLAQRIHDYLGGNAIVPEMGQTWEIAKSGVKKI